MKINRLILFLFLVLFIQCKDNDIWPNNFEGNYKLNFTVSQRPAMFFEDMNPTFHTELVAGYHMDLSQNTCCEPMPPTKPHGCPMEYSRNDFTIFKEDGEYFLKNKLIVDQEGKRVTKDIPLVKEGSILRMKDNLSVEDRYFVRNTTINAEDMYPLQMTLLELQFEIERTKIRKGRWKFIDLLGQPCYLEKDSAYYRYIMVEFAEFTAEKIE